MVIVLGCDWSLIPSPAAVPIATRLAQIFTNCFEIIFPCETRNRMNTNTSQKADFLQPFLSFVGILPIFVLSRAWSQQNNSVEVVAQLLLILHQCHLHWCGSLREAKVPAFARIWVLVHCLHLCKHIVCHIIKCEIPVLCLVYACIEFRMTLTVLSASTIADVNVMTQVSHVKLRWRHIASNDPVGAVHSHSMLEENGALACVSGLLVPYMEHGKIIVVICHDVDGLPFIWWIPYIHFCGESRVAHFMLVFDFFFNSDSEGYLIIF